ncbi:twin-arginine translocase TatA/TatE family subunit [Nitrospina gracilis]|uniref:twin-arginine translocase TatA/TatE family subunit n=1 Tax=Nitrospina gracilis TaxID=35801 RepID=UPI002351991C|nr:twin-arginine translocase TatA/TatE family subunit [Nitrospina gracilis]MCF8720414.1 TatA/E family protein of Tat protein translocase [Nitrospina gracilis Nb-211]
MMGIGFPELMVILVIIMIIFGAGKLPEIGSAFGNSIRNFKKSMKEAEEGEDKETAAVPEGHTQPAPAQAQGNPAPQPATQNTATTVPTGQASSQPVTAQSTGTAQTTGQNPAPNAKKKEKPKDEAEKMIEDAINELKEKRIGTVKTPHDGLVQQGDVFTDSLKRTPFGRGRDRGVSRDVF